MLGQGLRKWRYEPETSTIRSVPENYQIMALNYTDSAVDRRAVVRLMEKAPDLFNVLRDAAPLFAAGHDVLPYEQAENLYNTVFELLSFIAGRPILAPALGKSGTPKPGEPGNEYLHPTAQVNCLRPHSSGKTDVWIPIATTKLARQALEDLFAMDGIVNQRGVICCRMGGTPECIILRDEDEDILLGEPEVDDVNPDKHLFQHDPESKTGRCRLCAYPMEQHTLETKAADYRRKK